MKMNRESVSFRAWRMPVPPKSILIIRMHAIGDVAITFPSCAALRDRFPETRLDFLTTESASSLAEALVMFDEVHRFPSCRNRWERLRNALRWAHRLRSIHYDIVIDLQRNWVSRLIRRAVSPTAWTEFNRFAPEPAGLRTMAAFHKAGFEELKPSYKLKLKKEITLTAIETLSARGWSENPRLILINPAGLWVTRNWPIQYYVDFAKRWLEQESVKFLFLGTDRILQQAEYFTSRLRDHTINLVERTTLAEAFAILQHVDLVVSEDSGLMHMAWVSGVPTLALFGSSRHDWSGPIGEHTLCLHSGDLPCGACMSPTCRFNDVHCLTRYTPEEVYEKAIGLLQQTEKRVLPP